MPGSKGFLCGGGVWSSEGGVQSSEGGVRNSEGGVWKTESISIFDDSLFFLPKNKSGLLKTDAS
jgi:hypothetical protein